MESLSLRGLCGGRWREAETLTSEFRKCHFLSLKKKTLSLPCMPREKKKKIQQFMVLFILRQGVDGLSEVSDCAIQPD